MTGIRPATDDDLPALARLRWRWVEELGGCRAPAGRTGSTPNSRAST